MPEPEPADGAPAGAPASARVSVQKEGDVGSADLSPSSILRSKRHRDILNARSRRSPFEAGLLRACATLRLSPACCRRAAYLSRLVTGAAGRSARGNLAFFSIYRACLEYGVRSAGEADMAAAVRAAFGLRRRIRPMRALFAVESVLIQHGREWRAGLEGAGRQEHGPCPEAGPERRRRALLLSIRSEPLRRSALRLHEGGTSMRGAVGIVRRHELVGQEGQRPPAAGGGGEAR